MVKLKSFINFIYIRKHEYNIITILESSLVDRAEHEGWVDVVRKPLCARSSSNNILCINMKISWFDFPSCSPSSLAFRFMRSNGLNSYASDMKMVMKTS